MKTLRRIAAVSLISCLAASGGAFAQQTTTPAPATPPADKAAISKACSQQADARGLKGKARKHFRSECKRHGGKVE